MSGTYSLDKRLVGACLMRLAPLNSPQANTLYLKLASCWGASSRPDKVRTLVTLKDHDLDLLRELRLPVGVAPHLLKWQAVYRDPERPDVRVTVRSTTRPPKKRTFRVAGGRTRMTCVRIMRLDPEAKANIKENKMARSKKSDTTKAKSTATSRKAKSKKAAPPEEDLEDDDELAGLEDLEDLDDLDLEEPDVEDDEDDEDEEPAPKKRQRKSRTKKAAPVEDEDDEDEDDEGDEEEEKPAKKSRGKASKSDAGKKGGKKSSGRTPPTPPNRELPAGKLGATEIAELAGVTGREVRQFLRKNAEKYPKNEELNRYAFTSKQAERIAKAIKKG